MIYLLTDPGNNTFGPFDKTSVTDRRNSMQIE